MTFKSYGPLAPQIGLHLLATIAVFLISAQKIGIDPADCAVVENAKADGMTALTLFGDAKGCGLEDYDLTSFSDLFNILP